MDGQTQVETLKPYRLPSLYSIKTSAVCRRKVKTSKNYDLRILYSEAKLMMEK